MDSHDLGTSTVNETSPATRVIRFGVFEVDLRTAELRKQGVRIRLPGQSLQVLEALLLRPGELVTREELKQKLWPSDTFGDFEHGLNAAVNRVRDALGDSSDNPRFVETVPRRGYRFIAPVNGVAHSTGLDNVVHIAPPEPAPYEPPEPAPDTPRAAASKDQPTGVCNQLLPGSKKIVHGKMLGEQPIGSWYRALSGESSPIGPR